MCERDCCLSRTLLSLSSECHSEMNWQAVALREKWNNKTIKFLIATNAFNDKLQVTRACWLVSGTIAYIKWNGQRRSTGVSSYNRYYHICPLRLTKRTRNGKQLSLIQSMKWRWGPRGWIHWRDGMQHYSDKYAFTTRIIYSEKWRGQKGSWKTWSKDDFLVSSNLRWFNKDGGITFIKSRFPVI